MPVFFFNYLNDIDYFLEHSKKKKLLLLFFASAFRETKVIKKVKNGDFSETIDELRVIAMLENSEDKNED